MVLELAEHDRITGLQAGAPPALSDEVDCLGRSPGEDDLHRVLDTEQPGDLLPDPFKRLGGALAQGMQAAVDICRIIGHVVDDRLDNLPRLEAGRRRVEIDERNSRADLLMQGRECRPNELDVEPPVVVTRCRPRGSRSGVGQIAARLPARRTTEALRLANRIGLHFG